MITKSSSGNRFYLPTYSSEAILEQAEPNQRHALFLSPFVLAWLIGEVPAMLWGFPISSKFGYASDVTTIKRASFDSILTAVGIAYMAWIFRA